MYVGIDPGKSGGIAILQDRHATILKMPKHESEVIEIIWNIAEQAPEMVYLEKVGSMPGNAARSMFTFGRGVGLLVGGLLMAEIPFEEVAPKTWQKGLNIPGKRKGESKPQFKKRLCEVAKTKFPKYKQYINLDTCDALLLAEYCRRSIK